MAQDPIPAEGRLVSKDIQVVIKIDASRWVKAIDKIIRFLNG